MDRSIWKRAFTLVIALLLIAAFGCGKSAVDAQKNAIATPETVAIGEDAAAGSYGNNETAEHTGAYSVNGTTEEVTSGSYASSASYENTVVVQNAGQLKMTSADINKTGDAQGDFATGVNSAVAVLSKGQMTLSDSNITTSALGAFGCYVSGESSSLVINGSYVYTSGVSSPALTVHDGGTVSMTGGILSTEGMDSACLMLSGGNVTLSGVTLKAANNEFLRVLSGENTLTLDATAISANPILGADSQLQLKLVNGASFAGELGSELPAKVSVSLDATSTLSLTADSYITALVNADTTHQNIQSNGFSLYYDSNATENAYLNSQSYQLPGGGFLSPII
jgi:hypothetical protein